MPPFRNSVETKGSRILKTLGAVALAVFSAGTSPAAMMNVEFSGSLTRPGSPDVVPLGTMVQGRFSYQIGAQPRETTPYQATYDLQNFGVTIGGASYEAIGSASITDGSYNSALFRLRLKGSNLQLALGYFGLSASFPNFALPSDPAFFPAWQPDVSLVDVTLPGAGNYGAAQVVATVTPSDTAIPEPASWAMMIAGFSLAGAALRRRAECRLSVA